jgi:LppP/LprE lipoprotein
MRRIRCSAITAALGVSGGLLLGACGSGTKTVTVSSAPPVSQTATSTQPKTTSSSTTTPTTPAQTPPSGGTTGTTTTRSAPEPAFTKTEPQAEGLSAAAAVVRAKGFTPNDTSVYHEGQALRVLVGTRTGSGDGYGQQAFFFVNGRYIGTDSKLPSATVKVVSQGDTEVTLAYPLYRKSDPLSSPSAGHARVTFQLNNGKLVALGAIPPADSTTGPSRQ